MGLGSGWACIMTGRAWPGHKNVGLSRFLTGRLRIRYMMRIRWFS